MANSERSFQTELMGELKKKGVFVKKITDPTQSGVLDLYVCGMGWDGWIELKFIRSGSVVALSEKQRQFMIKHKQSGGRNAWLVCREGSRIWECFYGIDPKAARVDSNRVVPRFHGKPWDVEEILNLLVQLHKN